MRSLVLATLFLAVSSVAQADESCTAVIGQALDLSVAATTTLVVATKYMTSHDNLCDGGALAVQTQDGEAVDRAWAQAINAQTTCAQDASAQTQMAKLIASLHRRRLRISDQIAMLQSKCN